MNGPLNEQKMLSTLFSIPYMSNKIYSIYGIRTIFMKFRATEDRRADKLNSVTLFNYIVLKKNFRKFAPKGDK